jgi:hypothetical protein
MATVQGVNAVAAKLKAEAERYDNAVRAAQLLMGIALIKSANGRVPVRTGALRASAYVRVRSSNKQGIFTNIGYQARHAAAQHGNTRYRHVVGTAKFLAKSVAARRPSYVTAMATLTKYAYANRMTPSMVSNPFTYKPPKRKPRSFGPITREQHEKRESRKAARAAARRT